jgi:hypothetical protein
MKRFILKHTLALATVLGLLCGWLVVEATADYRPNTVATSSYFIDDDCVITGGVSDWQTHLGSRIVVVDSTGKQAIGWIGERGAIGGETYGPEILDNGGFAAIGNWLDNSGSTVWSIHDGICEVRSGATYSKLYQLNIATVGQNYLFQMQITGVTYAPTGFEFLRDYSNTGTYPMKIVGNHWGFGIHDTNSPENRIGVGVRNDTWATIDNVSITALLIPGASGCSIYAEPALSTNSWTLVDSGFDRNSIDSYNIERYPGGLILGYSGATRYFIDGTDRNAITGIAKNSWVWPSYMDRLLVVYDSSGKRADATITSYTTGGCTATSPGSNGVRLGPVTVESGFAPNSISYWQIKRPPDRRESLRSRGWKTLFDSRN